MLYLSAENKAVLEGIREKPLGVTFLLKLLSLNLTEDLSKYNYFKIIHFHAFIESKRGEYLQNEF
jgi:hypothetical protein